MKLANSLAICIWCKSEKLLFALEFQLMFISQPVKVLNANFCQCLV